MVHIAKQYFVNLCEIKGSHPNFLLSIEEKKYFLSKLEMVKDVTKEILRQNLIETR